MKDLTDQEMKEKYFVVYANYKLQQEIIHCTSKRIIIRAGRRSGKAVGVDNRGVIRFLASKRVLYAAPIADQVGCFWNTVTTILAEPIRQEVFIKNESEKYIELLVTNQRIKAKTAWNADSLRGDYADDLILDEFQLMSEYTWDTVGALDYIFCLILGFQR